MKAILIDPVNRTIREVDHNGDYRQIYEYLSDKENGLNVETFTVVQIDDVNCIYVDDEGLLKDPRYFFNYHGYPQPLAGRGLVLGTNMEDGESIGTTLSAEEVFDNVRFSQHSVEGFVTEEGKTDHPIAGKDTPFFKSTPVFGPPKED
jgi:hypothetical protein